MRRNRFQKPGYCKLFGAKALTVPIYVPLNVIAIVLHFTQTVATLIIFLARQRQGFTLDFATYEQYTKWTNIENSVNVTVATTTAMPGTVATTTSAPESINVTKTTKLICNDENLCFGDMLLTSDRVPTKNTISIAILIISFFGLSALFQGLAMVPAIVPGYSAGKASSNFLRFVEYSMSASVMLVAIALINGIFDQTIIVLIAVSCAACQLCGLVAERALLLHKLLRDRSNNKETISIAREIAYVAHFTGWILIGTAYYFIMRYYFVSNANSVESAPEFVTVIVFTILVLFMSFGVVQLIQLVDDRFPFLTAELIYVVLSLTSKTFLGWIIFANVLI